MVVLNYSIILYLQNPGLILLIFYSLQTFQIFILNIIFWETSYL